MELPILTYPLESQKIGQRFGLDNSSHPIRHGYYVAFDHKHPGVDFPVPIGTQVRAALSGIVVRSEDHHGYGKVIGLRNGNIVTLYSHLNRMDVLLGQVVAQGDVIGLSGDTGWADPKPHLHFEIRDITKSALKEMVFNPPFDKLIEQFRDQFFYTVNNTNTQKTLKTLAKLYFGDEKYWQKILDANSGMVDNEESVIAQETKLLIPNF